MNCCNNCNKAQTIIFTKINENAKIPTRGSEYAAGYDLYACLNNDSLTILPHETIKISTGLRMVLPDGYFGAIFPRSGLATKQGLRMANCVGVIDQDYRGEWIVSLHNDTEKAQTISNNERVAQLILLPYQTLEFQEIEEEDFDYNYVTKRGKDGFGSSGRGSMRERI